MTGRLLIIVGAVVLANAVRAWLDEAYSQGYDRAILDTDRLKAMA